MTYIFNCYTVNYREKKQNSKKNTERQADRQKNMNINAVKQTFCIHPVKFPGGGGHFKKGVQFRAKSVVNQLPPNTELQ